MSFPSRRLRRLRSTPAMRDLVRESTIDPSDLVLPIFVQEGIDSPVEIKSMPEMRRLPVKDAASEVESAVDLGIPAVMLFGIPAAKDDAGSAAYDAKGAVQQAISQIRSTLGEKIVIMADVCLGGCYFFIRDQKIRCRGCDKYHIILSKSLKGIFKFYSLSATHCLTERFGSLLGPTCHNKFVTAAYE